MRCSDYWPWLCWSSSAVEIAKVKKCLSTSKNINRKVIGFDINKRIEQLKKGIDITKSVDEHALINNSNLFFTRKLFKY